MEGTLSYRGMVRVTEELDCFSAHIRLREPDKSEDKVDTEVFEAGSRKGRGSDDESKGLNYPKAKRWSERRLTQRSATEADLLIVKKETKIQDNG
ncbi:hypothetical protein BHE74_00055813 [Ensete ventricosum]|nr:hypothetical protein BHE74_00055813 [Ensete ventricosum]